MSYPKVPPPAQRGPITKLSAQRRDRLLKIQEREELKGLLINKFKLKYGQQGAGSQYIEKEVDNFMKNEVLTEENLKKLDQRLKDQAAIEAYQFKQELKKQEQVGSKTGSKAGSKVPSKASSKGPPSVQGLEKDQKSVHSQNSKAPSVMSSGSQKQHDQVSIASSKMSEFSGLDNEEDEWAAILRYENIQFREEERARKQREKDLKMRIKRELDKQMQEKNAKKTEECEEDKMYEEALVKNLEEFDKREATKLAEVKQKLQIEKQLRDKQLLEEKKRKKVEEKEQREYDQTLVKRLQSELQTEQRALEQKRNEEKGYLKKVLEDNNVLKQKQLQELEQQKQRDIREAEEYIRMVDKQEADRAAEMAAREQRQQQLMAKMADTVIKEQNKKISEEDLMMLQQIRDREQFEQHEEEGRKKRQADQKNQMKAFLENQMKEKEKKKELERQERLQQAEMWKLESEEFFKLEEQKANKQKELNLQHAQILKQQMKGKQKGQKMNNIEMALNKKKLRQVKYQPNQIGEKMKVEEGSLEVVGTGVQN